MWKYICVLIFLIACCNAGPVNHQRKNMPIMAREDSAVMAAQESEAEKDSAAETEATAAAPAPLVGTLTLPSNATSIRADITDNFSCANKSYGYYADVENDCQIFHVCLPVTYADGKENTFRWSFICPEETIFSQESFTCMRREDMTIECEDSYRYYELNGNFGVPMEEEKQPAAAAESEQVDQQQAEPEQSELSEPAQPAAVAAPEPAPEPAKPVKVQSKPKPKPNRRKPAVTYNKPQRKAPIPATAAPVAEPVEKAEPEPEPETVAVSQVLSKPQKPQRFNPRPNKERPQLAKPAVPAPPTPMRNELFNVLRKRPTMFNKPSTNSNKPAVETESAVTEGLQIEVELSEPQPTLKLQTMFAAPSAPAEIEQEPVAAASEPVVAIAQPEIEAQPETVVQAEDTKTTEEISEVAVPLKVELEQAKPIEAVQEIPAVIEEVMEQMPQKFEQPLEMPEEQSQQLSEEKVTQISEEQAPQMSEEQPQQLSEEQAPQMSEEQAPQKSEEQAPQKSEQQAPQLSEDQPQQLSENQIQQLSDEQSEQLPEEQPKQQLVEQPEEQKIAATYIEPAIVETSSSKEESSDNLEAMETAKPADAALSLPATPEMPEANPLEEQTELDNSSSNSDVKESIGGFKPVDPAMAAEAEQLITEFLNTLRKHEEKTETEKTESETAAMDMAETIEQQPQILESEVQPMTTELKQDADNVSIEEAKLPEAEVVDKNASVEEQLLETAEAEAEPQPQLKLTQDSPIINIMQLNHLPADYQIPVRVIAAPEPEPQTEQEMEKETIKEAVAEAEIKPVEVEPSLATADYMPPISIDDIVELVKERLDQNPKNEQPTPMELILTPGAEAPMALISSNDLKSETESEPIKQIVPEIAAEPAVESNVDSIAQPASVPESEPASGNAQESEQEEEILPIYKRIALAEPAMSKVQTSPVTVSKVEVDAKPEEETAPSVPEVREPKSQSRMDARKRRFLFRADAS